MDKKVEKLFKDIIKDFNENGKEELEDHAYWILGRLRDLGSDWSSIANPILLNQIADHKYIVMELTKECDPITHKKMKEILKDEEKHLNEMEEFKKKYEDLFKDPIEPDKK